LRQMGYLGNF